MNVTSLPSDLKIAPAVDVQLYDYRIFNSHWRNKVTLTKNTFSFLIAGTKEVLADEESISIQNDHFLIIKAGNCLMTENISPLNSTYRSMLLFFTDDALLSVLKKYAFEFTTPQTHRPYLIAAYDPYLKNLVTALEAINQLAEAAQRQLLRIKFEELLVYLIQKEGVEFLAPILNPQDDGKRRFLKVVESNKLEKLSLQELAFLCNMSLSSFKRLFREYYKMAPMKWFQTQRLEHAKFLLNIQHKRPVEIFEEVGYESLSNFIQAFKKRYGYTPKKYQAGKVDS